MMHHHRLLLTAVSSVCLLSSCARPGDSTARAAPDRSSAVEVETSSGIAMMLLGGGEFMMGSSHGHSDELPRHRVRISPLAMDKYEVTQEQFAALEIPDPSNFKGDRRPVEQVRWSDAALFCNARSRAEGLDPCYDEATFACNFEANGYRLPTEAEWEYAARAGSEDDFDFGNAPQAIKAYACYAGNSRSRTDPVGQKRPNGWGLHDLYGNVSEWCQDVYDPDYYEHSPETDPRGPAEGNKRVLRGGAWNSSEAACRATVRLADVPGITDACFARNTYGFRCVRRLTSDESRRLQGDSPL